MWFRRVDGGRCNAIGDGAIEVDNSARAPCRFHEAMETVCVWKMAAESVGGVVMLQHSTTGVEDESGIKEDGDGTNR